MVSGRRPTVTAALLLAAVLSTTAMACGADEEPAARSDGTDAGLQDSQTGPTTDTDAADTTETDSDPTDGRLTGPSGKVITNFGDRRERVAAVRTLDELQHEFRAGEMTAACAKINDFLLSQFTPPGTKDETPCPKKLEAYAAQRARRGDTPERLELLWVRAYGVEAGIWVDDSKGKRMRIQITNNPEGWQFDLGALGEPEILAAELIGADEYVKAR